MATHVFCPGLLIGYSQLTQDVKLKGPFPIRNLDGVASPHLGRKARKKGQALGMQGEAWVTGVLGALASTSYLCAGSIHPLKLKLKFFFLLYV